MNIDLARAQAYVGKSLADQVTDMAEGARLMNGTAAVQNISTFVSDNTIEDVDSSEMARFRAICSSKLFNGQSVNDNVMSA